MSQTVKPGDVFYSSWGYDQTNVDYYAVSRVSSTGKTAWFVKIGKRHDGDSRVRADASVAECRHCGNGVRKLVRVDGSTVWRHAATGRTECQFYGYRAERLAAEGRVLHADVEELKRRVRVRSHDDGFMAHVNDYASMYSDDGRSQYQTPFGAGH